MALNKKFIARNGLLVNTSTDDGVNALQVSGSAAATSFTGLWDGTAIAATKGGTGATSYAVGDLLYANTTTTLAKLAAGTNGHVLTLAAGVPTWAAASGGGMTSTIVTGTTHTATANTRVFLSNAAATTVTLPASPTLGDEVVVVPCNGLSTNIIARNGNKIMGLSEDMTLNLIDKPVCLVYVDATLGWRLA